MVKKLTKEAQAEEDAFEEINNVDPTKILYEPSSELELSILKKLWFAQEQSKNIGMILSDFSFFNSSLNQILKALYLIQSKKISKFIRDDFRKQNIITENGIDYKSLSLDPKNIYDDLAFHYEINESLLNDALNKDINDFQNDLVFDLLYERRNKNFLSSDESSSVSLPYKQQKKEIIKTIIKISHNKIGYFQWDIEQKEGLRPFATLLSMEKEGLIEILDINVHANNHTIIEIKQKEIFEKDKINTKKQIEQNSDLEIIIEHNNLSHWSDGTIRFKNKIIDLTPIEKDLCILFLKKYNKSINRDDIEDEIINAGDKGYGNHDNIAKYISKLRNSLKPHFKKSIIFNRKKDGWYMKI